MLRALPIHSRLWRSTSVALAAVLLSSPTARADVAHTCAEAYEKAQVERKAGHIGAAIENLTVCSGEACPKFIRKDCIQWLAESQGAQPSVVFSVRHRDVDVSNVEISCDGRVLVRIADGKSVPIDPGPHVFVFRAQGFLPVERQLIVREGEHNRLVDAELKERATPTSALSASQVTTSQGPGIAPARSLYAYGLAGLGILGVSGFAVFGLWGNSQRDSLERTCSPYCRSDQVAEVRTKYIVADTCLAVGLVSAGLATYWLVTGQSAAAPARDTSVAVSPTAAGRGGVVSVSTVF